MESDLFNFIIHSRLESKKVDSADLRFKRDRFLNWLSSQYFDIRLLEMYENNDGEVIKSKIKTYNYFEPFMNTRLKIPSETILEIDKINDFKTCLNIFYEIWQSLIRNKIHFAVFYAEGQRSPHIRIYDFDELLELDSLQRVKAQILFWRQHVPFGCFRFVDTGVFQDEHPIQLEFSPHWRHRTPFDLLFEYSPYVTPTNLCYFGGKKCSF